MGFVMTVATLVGSGLGAWQVDSRVVERDGEFFAESQDVVQNVVGGGLTALGVTWAGSYLWFLARPRRDQWVQWQDGYDHRMGGHQISVHSQHDHPLFEVRCEIRTPGKSGDLGGSREARGALGEVDPLSPRAGLTRSPP